MPSLLIILDRAILPLITALAPAKSCKSAQPPSMASPPFTLLLLSLHSLFFLFFFFSHYAAADHISMEISPAPAPFPILHGSFSPSFSSPPSDPPTLPVPNHPSSPPIPSPAPFFDLLQPEDESDARSVVADKQIGPSNSHGGKSARSTATVATVAVAGVAIAGMAALVYKKRRQNIQRASHGYAARRDLL